MSNSKTRVTVEIADRQGELEIVDGHFNVVGRGFGVLDAELMPGLYKVRAQAGDVRTEDLFVVEPEAKPFTVAVDQLRFITPVPLLDTLTGHNDQRDALIKAIGDTPIDVGLESGASMLLGLRDPSDACVRQRHASPSVQDHYHRSFDGFHLRNPTGDLMLDFDRTARRVPDQGFAVLNFKIRPGPYVLSYEPKGIEPVAMPVLAVGGWQSQVFINLDLPEHFDAPGQPNLADRAVMMAPLGRRFQADDPYVRLAEIARYALIQGRQAITHERLEELLREKFQNPILGLFAAHLLLLEEQPNRDLLEMVTRNIADMIGADFPDVLALRIALAELDNVEPDLPQNGLPFPPLLRPSWNLIVDHPELLPVGSIARKVASRLVPNGPWLAWQPIGAAEEFDVVETAIELLAPPARLATPAGLVATYARTLLPRMLDKITKFIKGKGSDAGRTSSASTESTLPADDASAALETIIKLAREFPWPVIFARLRAKAAERGLMTRLTHLQKSLLPTLQLISAQLDEGYDFTLNELKQLREGLNVPLFVLRESLEDLLKKMLAWGWAVIVEKVAPYLTKFHTYEEIYRYSIEQPEKFWGEQAHRIYWHKLPEKILDYSNPPFSKWFVGGETNLCYNAVDRHLADRANQRAVIYISTETDETKIYTYAELHREVNRFAAVLQALGVGKGDRVIIYMPMIAEAAFAMLACARIGAIHSVVFGGFAAYNLAVRIDDAKPKVMVTSDAGMRGGKAVPYKHLVDESCNLAKFPPEKVVIVNRGLDKELKLVEGRDLDYATLRAQHLDAEVPITWLESNEPSYILYTSGTTGILKGVQRDVGGYTVTLAASMEYIYALKPGETMFTTSDIGWVMGHSYIVYAPLINGSPTIFYEGLPIRPDPGIWWKIVNEYKVRTMFSSPTAVRVLEGQDQKYMTMHDVSCLRYLFLAGEPLDEPTSRWITDALKIPVINHYWQTETGWPMLSYLPGVELKPNRFGSLGFPVYGYNIRVISEDTGEEMPRGEKGVLVVEPPLPPGCLSTVWGDDERFVQSYFSSFKEMLYTSSDWAVRDDDGYFFILGRTDDVINVAGHRLGTREIEKAIRSHPAIAEVVVVGLADQVKGQVPVGFARLKDPTQIDAPGAAERLEKEIIAKVQELLGLVAKPHAIHFVSALPKTRSGMLLRRSIQALAEGRDPGDLSNLDESTSQEQNPLTVARH